MIELHHVRKHYRKDGAEVKALDGVTLEIGRGEFVALVGPSGSGKSTLMNIVGLLDRPDHGTYRLDGQETGRFPADEAAAIRNARIGFVFQAFHLLPRTPAVENVELPLVYSRRSDFAGRGLEALARVGLADRAHHHPSELSGGQQQRVAIARALINDPALILADEPTGNLDSESGADILALFRELNAEGRTILLVTHDAHVAGAAHRTIRMVDGRIADDTRQTGAAVAGGPAAARMGRVPA